MENPKENMSKAISILENLKDEITLFHYQNETSAESRSFYSCVDEELSHLAYWLNDPKYANPHYQNVPDLTAIMINLAYDHPDIINYLFSDISTKENGTNIRSPVGISFMRGFLSSLYDDHNYTLTEAAPHPKIGIDGVHKDSTSAYLDVDLLRKTLIETYRFLSLGNQPKGITI